MTEEKNAILKPETAKKLIELLEKTEMRSAQSSHDELKGIVIHMVDDTNVLQGDANALAIALVDAVEGVERQQEVGGHTEYMGLSLDTWKKDYFPAIKDFAGQAKAFYEKQADERLSGYFERLAKAVDRLRAADEQKGASWAGRVGGEAK